MRLIKMTKNNVEVMGALTLLAGTNRDLLDLFVGNKTREDAGDRLIDMVIEALEYYTDNKPSACFENAGVVIATGMKHILNLSHEAPADIIRDCLIVMIAAMSETANGVVEGPKNA